MHMILRFFVFRFKTPWPTAISKSYCEYPGAASNPEVVAPLNKLKDLIGDAGGGAVEVYGRLSGNDILISSERSANRRSRRTG